MIPAKSSASALMDLRENQGSIALNILSLETKTSSMESQRKQWIMRAFCLKMKGLFRLPLTTLLRLSDYVSNYSCFDGVAYKLLTYYSANVWPMWCHLTWMLYFILPKTSILGKILTYISHIYIVSAMLKNFPIWRELLPRKRILHIQYSQKFLQKKCAKLKASNNWEREMRTRKGATILPAFRLWTVHTCLWTIHDTLNKT